MTARNAFEGLAEEPTLEAVRELIDALVTLAALQREQMGAPNRLLPYSKDVTTDAMRVNPGTLTLGTREWGSFQQYPAYYARGSDFALDQRDTAREMSNARAHAVHTSWTVT